MHVLSGLNEGGDSAGACSLGIADVHPLPRGLDAGAAPRVHVSVRRMLQHRWPSAAPADCEPWRQMRLRVLFVIM